MRDGNASKVHIVHLSFLNYLPYCMYRIILKLYTVIVFLEDWELTKMPILFIHFKIALNL